MSAIKQVIRTLLAGALAFLFFIFFSNQESYWLFISALFLVQVNVSGDSLRRNNLIILNTGCLAILNVFLMNLCSYYFLSALGYITLITFLLGFLSIKYSEFKLPLLLIYILGIFSYGFLATTDNLLLRLDYMIAGTAIAMLVRSILWPPRMMANMQALCIEYLRELNSLQCLLFYIYLKRDYKENHYAYEKDISGSLQELFIILKKIRVLINKLDEQQKKSWNAIFDSLNQIMEIMISLGSLRYRLTDHSTLEVCEKELRAMSLALTMKLFDLIKNIKNKSHIRSKENPLEKALQAFDNIYQNTLQVIINDPIIFLIFIQNVNLLKKALNQLEVEISK